MVAFCHLKIKETSAQLQNLLSKEKTAASYQKIQALYLFKTGLVETVKDIALAVGVHRVSVQRWFKKYQNEGLEGLLTVGKQTGRPRAISSAAEKGLKERLSNSQNGFKSYGAIQKWLQVEYGEDIDYKTLYGLVRYKLKAKLKVPRKSSIKKNPEQAFNFKKN